MLQRKLLGVLSKAETRVGISEKACRGFSVLLFV